MEGIKFVIKIKYTTGNSYGSSPDEDIIPMVWTDLMIAKENLVRIKEHDEMYKELKMHPISRPNRPSKDILSEYSLKQWFYSNPSKCGIDQCESESNLLLIDDNRLLHKVNCFWTGYFEDITSAEITIDMSDMKIEF